ncbi:MAG: acyl-CoA thioesterase [Holophagaceae bacterium]|jgi:acyl-CoA thioester hydrolase
MPSRTTLDVRYVETDAMGIVHHSNFLHWMEVARTDFMKDGGKSYRDFESKGLRLVVIGVEVVYRGSARYGDRIQIETDLIKIHSRGGTFRYRIFAEERLIATGHTEHLTTDTSGRTISIPPEWLDYLKHLHTLYSGA